MSYKIDIWCDETVIAVAEFWDKYTLDYHEYLLNVLTHPLIADSNIYFRTIPGSHDGFIKFKDIKSFSRSGNTISVHVDRYYLTSKSEKYIIEEYVCKQAAPVKTINLKK